MNSDASTGMPVSFDPGPLRELAAELSRWTSQMEAHAGVSQRKCRARLQKGKDLTQELERSVARARLME